MKSKKTARAAKATKRKTGRDRNRYPKGWDARSIKALAAHYDNQSDEEAIAEAEAAYRSTTVTMMAIPVELVPKVLKLLAKRVG